MTGVVEVETVLERRVSRQTVGFPSGSTSRLDTRTRDDDPTFRGTRSGTGCLGVTRRDVRGPRVSGSRDVPLG